jgi:ADP-ribose pyrophosphatase YjhB (NUDIX family)
MTAADQNLVHPRNPYLTVDLIIEMPAGVVLIERRNPPLGWALPGGFVDYGETIEAAALREAKEETGLDVLLIEQFHCYSAPDRDPRHHTVTTVFIAVAEGKPEAADDAAAVGVFDCRQLPDALVFDHAQILRDYCRYRQGAARKEIFRLNPHDPT